MIQPICREVPVMAVTAGESDGQRLFSLRLGQPGWDGWQPGQFVMLRLRETGQDLVWARPFSICRADGESLTLFIQEAGRGTERIARLRPGDEVDIWGPLGNAFAMKADTPTLLAAGGIGLAPFVGYIERHPSPDKLRLLFGHRLPLDAYPYVACAPAGMRENHHECCPADLERFISALEAGMKDMADSGGMALACGPLPFLRTVRRLALAHSVPAQLSLETRMACGVGACLGCVVRGKSTGHAMRAETGQNGSAPFTWVQTCTCGPVFWAHDLDLEDGR